MKWAAPLNFSGSWMLPMSQKICIEAVSDPGAAFSYNNLNPLSNVVLRIIRGIYIMEIVYIMENLSNDGRLFTHQTLYCEGQ
jgi:hypothetical protein